MTFSADEPVESGCSYRVTEVDGHRPHALGDFAGDTRLTLVRGGMSHRLVGDGNTTGGGVAVGCVFTRRIPGPTTVMSGCGSSPILVTERFWRSRSPHSDDHPAGSGMTRSAVRGWQRRRT